MSFISSLKNQQEVLYMKYLLSKGLSNLVIRLYNHAYNQDKLPTDKLIIELQQPPNLLIYNIAYCCQFFTW